MDNKVIPIILQHVRELAEVHLGGKETTRHKIITPFPPVWNDFKDFRKENLEFTDSQSDSVGAKTDTLNAYDFFKATDNLYYNYSYGIQSQNYFLSHVCNTFYKGALFTDTEDTNFIEAFKAKKDAFLSRFKRSTAGDLGQLDFIYTSLSAIQWNNGRISLAENDIRRLKEKALAVYENIREIDAAFIGTITAEIESAAYSKIEYDLGFFDVIREWVDPDLFESNRWRFSSDSDALYGVSDDAFQANDVKLCYGQRYYIIKNYTGTLVSPAVGDATGVFVTPTVRDHRTSAASPGGGVVIRDHRKTVRDLQLRQSLHRVMQKVDTPTADTPIVGTPTDPTGKFVWVKDHWERKKANAAPPVETEPDPLADSVYRIAAVTCRIIPWKPAAILAGNGNPPVTT